MDGSGVFDKAINRYLAKAFTDQPISDASRTISWAMLINITVIPMITGFDLNEYSSV